MSVWYEFGPFRLEPDEERLTRDGAPVALTPKALDTLVVLVQRAGTLVDKEVLFREVWPGTHVEEANISVNVSTIRKALGDGVEGHRYIETVPKRGYRFVAPVHVHDTRPATEATASPATEGPAAGTVLAAGGVIGAGATAHLPAPSVPRRRFWKLVLGAIPAAGVAVAFGAFALSRSSARRGGFEWERMATQGRLRLLLPDEAGVTAATLSPAGRMLAYVRVDPRGEADLFIAQVNGGGTLRLTSDAAREGQPCFSPDGRSLAFTRRLPPAIVPEIWVVPALGGRPPRAVTTGTNPAWSPDGDRLAFIGPTRPGGPQALFTCALDGTDQRQLLTADGVYPFLRSPAWSPDGRTLAVVRGTGGVAGEIWLVPVDGGTPQRLTERGTHTWSDWPRFTADGSSVVHTSNRGGATNLWVQRLAEKAPIRLTTGPGPDEFPSVSREGAVAFVSSRGRNELFVHALDAGRTPTIFAHTPYLWAPVFSPDGREITFTRGEVDGSWHLWTVSVEGGPPRQLTTSTESEIYPRYARDGSAVFFQTRAPGRIWRVPRNGGTPVPLTTGEHEDGYADPSPDGSRMAFARAEGEEHIYVAPLAGGMPRQLVERASTVPKWSPDGTLIAFSPGRGYDRGIFVVGADGTGERRLTERGGWPVWWPDGSRLSYLMLDADGSQQIWTVALKGGPPELVDRVTFPGSTNCPFDIASDGKRIVSTRVIRESHEVWLLEPPATAPPGS